MQGNDEVNESKLEKVLGGNVRPAHHEELLEITGADAGSIGPIGFKGRIISDLKLKDRNNLFSGANKNDYHIGGIDFLRDVKNNEYADLRIVQSGEGCPMCNNNLEVFPQLNSDTYSSLVQSIPNQWVQNLLMKKVKSIQ